MNAMYLAHYAQDAPYMMERTDGGWLHGLFGLLMLALVVVGVIWVVKTLAHHHAPINHDPLDVAKERYAKGEITKEELAEIRKELAHK